MHRFVSWYQMGVRFALKRNFSSFPRPGVRLIPHTIEIILRLKSSHVTSHFLGSRGNDSRELFAKKQDYVSRSALAGAMRPGTACLIPAHFEVLGPITLFFSKQFSARGGAATWRCLSRSDLSKMRRLVSSKRADRKFVSLVCGTGVPRS